MSLSVFTIPVTITSLVLSVIHYVFRTSVTLLYKIPYFHPIKPPVEIKTSPAVESGNVRHSCKHCAQIEICPPVEWPAKKSSFIHYLDQTVYETKQAIADDCPFFQHFVGGMMCYIKDPLSFMDLMTWRERAMHYCRAFSRRPFYIYFSKLSDRHSDIPTATFGYRLHRSVGHLDVSANKGMVFVKTSSVGVDNAT